MTGRPCLLTALALAASLALVGESAWGQTASDVPGFSAEALFAEGRRSMSQGNIKLACAQFAESERLDPAVGTLMNLARCEKALGRTASAWLDYREAAARARAAGESKREEVARSEADALAGIVPHLHLEVPETARLPGFELTLDAAVCPSALWNTSIPLDPGPHTLRARAPEHAPWETSVELVAAQESSVLVPLLAPSPGDSAPPSRTESSPAAETQPQAALVPLAPGDRPADHPAPAHDPLRIAGYVTGGVGLALLVTAGAFALHAKNVDAESHQNDHCDASGCDAEGLRLNHEALRSADLAAGFAIAGTALVAGGVTLLLVPRRTTAAHAGEGAGVALSLRMGPISALRGTW